MCGIFGAISLGARPLPVLPHAAMAQALRHRGPDGEAVWRSDRAMLGITRLAIVAPREAASVHAHGNIRAVTNGELYNHGELRQGLPPAQRPSSGVDTALMPALYSQLGAIMVRALRGMYATALWDEGQSTLHLWRDPVGKKPLFYAQAGDVLLFASEPKGIHASGLVRRVARPEAAQRVFLRGFLDENESWWTDIHALPAGWQLTAGHGRWRVTPFSHLEATQAQPARESHLEALFARAVATRIPGEVKSRVLLSSGVDSSLVAAAAKVPTLHMNMRGTDEAGHARRFAHQQGLSFQSMRPTLARAFPTSVMAPGDP